MNQAPEIMAGTSSIRPSELLIKKVAAARGKRVMLLSGTGVMMFLAGFVLWVGVEMLLDWYYTYSLGTRWVFFILLVLGLGFLAVRYVILPFLRQPSEDEVALMVERFAPHLKSRLISSLQLPRPNALGASVSRELVGKLIDETEKMASGIKFNDAIPAGPFLKTAGVTVLIFALGLAGLFFSGETGKILLKRAFLSKVQIPRKTNVTILSGNLKVLRGDNVSLEAKAEGVIPPSGMVFIKFSSGSSREFSMDKGQGESTKYIRVIDSITESFKYYVRLNDGVSETFQVQVTERPTILSVDCEQVFPAYTKNPPVKRLASDLNILAGSHLNFKFKADRKVQKGIMKLAGLNKEIPLEIDEKDPAILKAGLDVPAKDLKGFSIQLTDMEGVESGSSAIYPITIVQDSPPVVRIIIPVKKEELATAKSINPIGFEAADDFGLAKLILHYKNDKVNDGQEQSVEIKLPAPAGKSLRRKYEWVLSDLKPPVSDGCTLEYWLEARDNNSVTGPGIGFSDRFFLKIVSPLEKMEEINNRLQSTLDTIPQTVTDQESVTKSLLPLIQEKDVESSKGEKK